MTHVLKSHSNQIQERNLVQLFYIKMGDKMLSKTLSASWGLLFVIKYSFIRKNYLILFFKNFDKEKDKMKWYAKWPVVM